MLAGEGDELVLAAGVAVHTAESVHLPPGDWVLQVSGLDVAAQQVPFAIRDGVDTERTLELAAGTRVTVHVALPRDSTQRPLVRVFDAAGNPLLLSTATTDGERRALVTTLRPGRYRATAECEAGDTTPALGGSAEFEVAAAKVVVEMTLGLR